MNFAEIRFWQLLAGGLAVIFFLRFFFKNPPSWFDKGALLSLGLFLLLCVSGITFVIFCVVAVGSYFGLKWILQFHLSPEDAALRTDSLAQQLKTWDVWYPTSLNLASRASSVRDKHVIICQSTLIFSE